LALGDDIRIADLAKLVVSDGLSVREVELRVRETTGGRQQKQKAASGTPGDTRAAEVRQIEEQLRRRFQTDAKLTLTGKTQGQISLSFYSNEDLSRLLELLLGGAQRDIA
jgi:ParB family chromosome partitioning protein